MINNTDLNRRYFAHSNFADARLAPSSLKRHHIREMYHPRPDTNSPRSSRPARRPAQGCRPCAHTRVRPWWAMLASPTCWSYRRSQSRFAPLSRRGSPGARPSLTHRRITGASADRSSNGRTSHEKCPERARAVTPFGAPPCVTLADQLLPILRPAVDFDGGASRCAGRAAAPTTGASS